MKRTLSFILALAMMLFLCACGSKEPEGPPEPSEWVINTEYISQRVTEFKTSEELKFLQDIYAETVVEFYGTDKVYGPYLTGAAEVYALRGDGKGQHYILMGFEGDMKYASDAYHDRVQVVYDIDSGSYYDSLSQNRMELRDHYSVIQDSAIFITINGGSNYQEALENIPRTFGGGTLNPGYVFMRELTVDEIASINTALALEPLPLRGVAARPDLVTTPEERQQIIVDAVKQLVDRELYYVLYPDCSQPMVEAAAEFAIVTSLDTHNIIIKLADADTNLHGDTSDKLVVDMKTGTVYSQLEFDWEAALTEAEGIAYLLADVSKHVFSGQEEFFWSSGEESNYKLTEDEIAAINKELAAYFAENPIEPLPTEPPAEPEFENPESGEVVVEDAPQKMPVLTENGALSVSNQFVIDALRSIQNTKHYQTYAVDPATIGLQAAYEYYLEDFEGFEVHLIMLRVAGIDTDLYGFSSNVFLVNPDTGAIYSEFELGLDYTGNIGKIEDAYVAILCSSFWQGDSDFFWSEMETITSIPESDQNAINNALK